MLYDRFYDVNALEDEQGNKVAFDYCDAAIPDANGTMPVKQCFGEGCKLKGYPGKRITNQNGEALLPETAEASRCA